MMLCEPCRARIALSDRIRRNQPECAAFAQQPKGAAEEMCDKIGVAMRAFMQHLQPGR